MAAIPGGSFKIGIDGADVPRLKRLFNINAAQLFEPEIPGHEVTIGDFYLDKYPVPSGDPIALPVICTTETISSTGRNRTPWSRNRIIR
jgi:hypothetical protein